MRRDVRQETDPDWTWSVSAPHRIQCFHATLWCVLCVVSVCVFRVNVCAVCCVLCVVRFSLCTVFVIKRQKRTRKHDNITC